jgi:hypothetical protein
VTDEDLLSDDVSAKPRGIKRIWIARGARITAQSFRQSYGTCGYDIARARGIGWVYGASLLDIRRSVEYTAPAAHTA